MHGVIESLVVPLVTIGAFLFFAAWMWVKGYSRKAGLVAAIGITLSIYAFWVDYFMRVTTIVEVFLEGSTTARPGDPAPLRQLRFTVEHPGAQHEVFLSPHAPEARLRASRLLSGSC
jgi:hypothetical protein